MKKLTFLATMLAVAGPTMAAAQQASVPTAPKPVHPTPVPATACRGCTDAMTGRSTSVKGYDDKSADTTRKTPPASARKPATKAKAPKHRAVKAKTSSRAAPKKAKTSAVTKRKPPLSDKPAVLDPLMTPHTPLKAKATRDTTKN